MDALRTTQIFREFESDNDDDNDNDNNSIVTQNNKGSVDAQQIEAKV